VARILFVTQSFWPTIGGIEVRARLFLPAMIKRGHDCLVLTTRELSDGLTETDECDGVPIVRLPFSAALRTGDAAGIALLRRRYAALIAEFRPDLVHVFYGGTLPALPLFGAPSRIPLLASFTSWPLPMANAGETMLGRLLQRASWVTANSARLVDLLRETMPSIGDRNSVIYSGNPWPTIEPAGLPFGPATILCIGRLVERKGFDLMIRAMPEILRHFPETQLRIAGDGPSMNALRSIVAEVKCDDHVAFTGWIRPDRVSETINDGSFVVIPSRGEEPFASVAIQAMQMARPCIATLCGGMGEAVVNGETGYLAPPEDPAVLARAALTLLGDPRMASAMGYAGRERARTMFGWDRYLDDFADIYQRLAGTDESNSREQ
jgi:glycosyltransferase involved in cell wall biosynthesis